MSNEVPQFEAHMGSGELPQSSDDQIKANLDALAARGKKEKEEKESPQAVTQREHDDQRRKEIERIATEDVEADLNMRLKALRIRLMNALKVLFRLARGETTDFKGSLFTLISMLVQINSLSSAGSKKALIENKMKLLMQSEDILYAVEAGLAQQEAARVEPGKDLAKKTDIAQLSEKEQGTLGAEMAGFAEKNGMSREDFEHMDVPDLAAA